MARPTLATAELAIIVPTLNEVDNVDALVARLDKVMADLRWEVIFVDDDSADGTANRVRELARQRPDVRCLQRVGRRGLASACVEGMLATSAPYLVVMDGDLQHDESLLPSMLSQLRKSANLDIVVASRFLPGASLGGFAEERQRLSRLGIRLSSLVTKAQLTDPLSGFFMLRRETLHEVVHDLTSEGFKILLDIFASSRRTLRYAEVPLHFRERRHGQSKLDTLVELEFLMLIADKLLGGWVPVRFVLFVLVGALGLALHLTLLGVLHRGAELSFWAAQAGAIAVAMCFNYWLNNVFTYRDRRRRGWGHVAGLASFALACGAGAAINMVVAVYTFNAGAWWPVAGVLGAAVGAVWNYAITSTFTWRGRRRG